MSTTQDVACDAASNSKPGRLPRSRSSSVTESASPESTSYDSHSSSDPDTHLSFASISAAKGIFSMDVDPTSNNMLMDMDPDVPFDTDFDFRSIGGHGIPALPLNTFQSYNVNLDDLSSLSTHGNSNTKSDILMLEELIKDGAFEPSSDSIPSPQSYPARPSAFRDLFIPPPPPLLHESYPEPPPDSVCIDPSSTQSCQPSLSSDDSKSCPVTSKTEPPGVLLLSPTSQATSNTSTLIKHEPFPSHFPLLPDDPSHSIILSSEVVHPPKDACHDLPIFFPSIPTAGTKSRVETQIKVAFELGFPKPTFSSSPRSPRPQRLPAMSSSAQDASSSSSESSSPSVSPALEEPGVSTPDNRSGGMAPGLSTHDKVGSYKFLRLPRGTATKRRLSTAVGLRWEPRACEVQPEETLDMTAEVVCCSSPHTLVHSCSSCQSREAKRTARKLAARVRPPPSARSKSKGKAGGKKSGKKAKNEDAEPVEEDAPIEEEEDDEPNADASIIQFNCSEILDFGGGAVVLPVRITCYCRHHKEKVGFNIVFTLRDHTGRVIGRGMTPPVLITDDHKSTSAVSKLPPMHPLRQALNPPPPPPIISVLTDASEEPKPPPIQEQAQARAPAKRRDTDDVGKKRRPKPYDGRPLNRGTGIGPGIEGRQGVVLALHPAHAKGQEDVPGRNRDISGAMHQATPTISASPGAEPLDGTASSTPLTQLTPSPPRPEASLPSPPRSLSGTFVPSGDVMMSALEPTPGFSRSSSPPMLSGSTFLPTAPPSPSSLSSPSPSQADLRAQQPPLQSLPDLRSFSQPHHSFLDPSHFPVFPSLEFTPSPIPLPKIHRLIPSSGPTTGGIEITVLGSNFHESLPLMCVFGGTVASSTHRWSDNTLVCVLPPRASPGLVYVGFKDIKDDAGETGSSLFNYVDESDRQLMELALQVVGLKMTGKIEEARSVALRIVGNTNTPATMTPGEVSQINSLSGTPFVHPSFLGSLSGMDLEALIIKLLTLLDISTDGRAESLPSACQAIGHQNATGQTLLHLAVLLALPALVSCLAERSIDLDAPNTNGLTALHFAALTGWKEGTEILLAAGADASIVDRMGFTAAGRARSGRFEELANLLEESAEHESSPHDESGDEGDDEGWQSEEDLSADSGSDAVASPSWPAGPPPYMAPPRIASPSHIDSSPDELSEADPNPAFKASLPQSEKPITNGHSRQASIDDKSTLKEKHDESFVERLQRTLPQGILPNVQIPGLPQLQLPDMLAGPWGALPQIPIFPVFVPIPNLPQLPNWPAFPWLDALSGEKKGVPVDETNGKQPQPQQQPPLATLWTAYDSLANNAWRTQWEKWFAQVMALQNANTRATEQPPMYTPRLDEKQSQPETQDTPGASTSRSPAPKATWRIGYGAVKVPETEVDSYHYQPKKKPGQKKDRMLVFFWIPILFIGLAYALYTTFPVAVAGLSRATKSIFPQLPQRDEIHV